MSSKTSTEGYKKANEIISAFSKHTHGNTIKKLYNIQRKKQAKKSIELYKNMNRTSFLDSRYNGSNKCEVIWGEWSLGSLQSNEHNTTLKYDKVMFDLTLDLPKEQIYKFCYINFSKHALVRLLERISSDINNDYDLRSYLDIIIEKILFRCLNMWDENKKEGYEVFEDTFLPIVMEKGINIYKKPSVVFVIKTVMPTSYSGSKKSIKTIEQSLPHDSLFDYWHLLNPKPEVT